MGGGEGKREIGKDGGEGAGTTYLCAGGIHPSQCFLKVATDVSRGRALQYLCKLILRELPELPRQRSVANKTNNNPTQQLAWAGTAQLSMAWNSCENYSKYSMAQHSQAAPRITAQHGT